METIAFLHPQPRLHGAGGVCRSGGGSHTRHGSGVLVSGADAVPTTASNTSRGGRAEIARVPTGSYTKDRTEIRVRRTRPTRTYSDTSSDKRGLGEWAWLQRAVTQRCRLRAGERTDTMVNLNASTMPDNPTDKADANYCVPIPQDQQPKVQDTGILPCSCSGSSTVHGRAGDRPLTVRRTAESRSTGAREDVCIHIGSRNFNTYSESELVAQCTRAARRGFSNKAWYSQAVQHLCDALLSRAAHVCVLDEGIQRLQPHARCAEAASLSVQEYTWGPAVCTAYKAGAEGSSLSAAQLLRAPRHRATRTRCRGQRCRRRAANSHFKESPKCGTA